MKSEKGGSAKAEGNSAKGEGNSTSKAGVKEKLESKAKKTGKVACDTDDADDGGGDDKDDGGGGGGDDAVRPIVSDVGEGDEADLTCSTLDGR